MSVSVAEWQTRGPSLPDGPVKTKRSKLPLPTSTSAVKALTAGSGPSAMDRQRALKTSVCQPLVVMMLAALALVGVGPAWAAGDLGNGTASGLALPRFVSLKADRVNVRRGPTKDNDVTWVYTRAGLPVEITAEYENWRRIRDWEGAEGWVYHSMLSGRRTVLVTARTKTADELIPIYEKADVRSDLAARLQPGVLGVVRRCVGSWCRITGEGFDGWIDQARLWGVYPNESVD
jgi:SH3-like domain-containing protein